MATASADSVPADAVDKEEAVDAEVTDELAEPAEPETLEGRAAVIQEKLDATYRQIVFLDQQIRDLKRLYRRAEQNNKYAFRYNIRMKMSIASGIKMMFYHYANTKVTELERITAQMERSTASDTSDGV
ncbi:hypothetical protein HPB47_004631 [Ixodes persulcatus]|uniref:Uncharacterized protein n=1 Tax=Ixodes persulcatus TaxID=34615 RepID=A0AC60PFD0_IXOPE|nr:uncharacterized protein LOC8043093 [Ixodes scapularis]KAG0418732.1 hypothetical protein HPB47_004631 [Ixodes persulcatus]